MRFARILVFALSLGLFGANRLSLASPSEPATEQQIGTLIQQLEDRASATRDWAESQLIEIGTPAKPQLATVLADRERAEARTRAARILNAIEHRETQARIVAFRKQTDAFIANDARISPPSWQRFSQIVGKDGAARRFFIGMLVTEPLLMAAYDRGPQEATAEFEKYWTNRDANRIQQLFPTGSLEKTFPGLNYQFQAQRSNATLATLLLLAGDERVKLPEPTLLRLINENRWDEPEGLQISLPLRKLFQQWIQSPIDETQSELFSRKIAFAANYKIKEVTDWLVEVARDSRRPIARRTEALLAIQRFDDASQRTRLETLLKDPTALQDGTPFHDVVLATLVRLSDQSWTEYGFSEEAPNFLAAKEFRKLSFDQQEQRDRAFARWQKWAEQERAWNNRLEAFASDRNGSKNLELPGWQRFQTLVGNSPEARALFAEMQRFERNLIAAYDQAPASADKLLYRYLNERDQAPIVSPGSLGTVLFLALDQHADCWPIKQRLNAYLYEPQIVDIKKSPNLPIQALLDQLETRENRLATRLELFTQDSRGIWKLSLPGWHQFKRQLGASPASRQFFAEMQLVEPALLAAYQQGPQAAAKELEKSCQRYRDFPYNYSTASLAASLLVLGDERIQISDTTLPLLCEQIRQNPRDTNFGAQAMRTLLAGWINGPTDSNMLALHKIDLALAYDLRECQENLIELAANLRFEPKTRSRAMLSLAILADENHLDAMEPLLKDRSVYKQEKGQIQLRDLALAVLVHVSGQPFDEYGFRKRPAALDGDLLLEQPEGLLELDLANRREAALDQWQKWSAANREFRAKLAELAKNIEQDQAFQQLPAWGAYSKAVGDTPRSRKLFLEMQQASPRLLSAYQRNRREAIKAFQHDHERRSLISGWYALKSRERRPSLGTVAAQLLVATDEQLTGLEIKVNYLQHDLSNDADIYDAIEKHYLPEMVKMISALVRRPPVNDGINELYDRVGLHSRYPVREAAIDFHVDGLTRRQEQDLRGQQWAWGVYAHIEQLMRLGDETSVEAIQLLESFFDDTTPVLPGSPRSLVICDLALATLIYMTDQKFHDYKLRAEVQEENGRMILNPSSVNFEHPDDRVAAQAKWREWAKKNIQATAKPRKPKVQQINRKDPRISIPNVRYPQEGPARMD